MKFAFLAGGFAGFALAVAAGFSAGREADLVLRDAAIACLVGALLFRWFWSVVVNAFGETVALKRAAAEAQPAPKAAAVPAPAAANRAAR